MIGLLSKIVRRKKRRVQCSLARTYQAISSASSDQVWQKLVDLADVSWHPVFARTNVPRGLVVKPGLIFEAVTRLVPIPIQVFVERVNPGELFSARILLPGLEEQITYQVQSTVLGVQVSYSIALRGWLSPLAWRFVQRRAATIATKLSEAAEQAALQAISGTISDNLRDSRSRLSNLWDFEF